MRAAGFDGQGGGVFVREGEDAAAAGELSRLLVAPQVGDAARAEGGRGTARRVLLADGRAVWLRRYRHGGLAGSLLGENYLGWSTRPEREIRATDTARAAGLLVPEALAAGVWRRGPCYQAALVSLEIPARRSLRTVLAEETSPEAIDAWLGAIVRDVARLHNAGVHHPDLNLTNLLVSSGPDDAIAFLDFDRARVFGGPVPRGWRRLAERRLRRSLAKLPAAASRLDVFASRWRAG